MEIIKIKEKKDGSTIITYILNDEEEKICRYLAKERKIRFSKKFCNMLVLEGIQKIIEQNEK